MSHMLYKSDLGAIKTFVDRFAFSVIKVIPFLSQIKCTGYSPIGTLTLEQGQDPITLYSQMGGTSFDLFKPQQGMASAFGVAGPSDLPSRIRAKLQNTETLETIFAGYKKNQLWYITQDLCSTSFPKDIIINDVIEMVKNYYNR